MSPEATLNLLTASKAAIQGRHRTSRGGRMCTGATSRPPFHVLKRLSVWSILRCSTTTRRRGVSMTRPHRQPGLCWAGSVTNKPKCLAMAPGNRQCTRLERAQATHHASSRQRVHHADQRAPYPDRRGNSKPRSRRCARSRPRLSAYDASYLELAMRHGVPLATKDIDLAKAANCMGVTLLPTA